LYDLPYRFWRAMAFDPHDLEAPAPSGGKVRVEVRARVNRNHWQQAKDDVYTKLPAPGDFAAAAGILFAPRTSPRTHAADILIMDPEGKKTMSDRAHDPLRSLLLHYIPFFEHQGGHPSCATFARRLRQLAEADEAEFEAYLKNGDRVLRQQRPYRTGFRFGGHDFKGSTWIGAAWPDSITGVVSEPGQGAFYWALWTKVIDALKEGRLQDLAEMEIRTGMQRLGSKVFVLLDDGIALAWAPSAAELSPGMFDQPARLAG
jgi:hypothetical protein